MTEPLDTCLDFSGLMEAIARGEGLSPTSGRILGYLLMSPMDVAFSDLATALGVSRGGVSENTRVLEDHGIIERCRRSDDRRDYFRVRDDAGDTLHRRARERAITNLVAVRLFRERSTLTGVQRSRLDAIESHLRNLVGVPPLRPAKTGARA